MTWHRHRHQSPKSGLAAMKVSIKNRVAKSGQIYASIDWYACFLRNLGCHTRFPNRQTQITWCQNIQKGWSGKLTFRRPGSLTLTLLHIILNPSKIGTGFSISLGLIPSI